MSSTPSRPQSPIISVSRKAAVSGVDPRTIKRRAAKVLVALSLPHGELSVVLCDDPFIQDLNRDYRGKDRPTDVLSFPMWESLEDIPQDGTALLGDVIISVPTAERQAAELGHTLRDEVTSLLIHGILHLIGHDHMDPEEEKRMHALAHDLQNLFG